MRRSERFARARPHIIALAILALAALACLGWWIGHRTGPAQVTARPALWHVTQGNREAYLFGTIHAVPKGEVWLSPVIAQAVERSDVLILEVTGLERERKSRDIFERLGRSAGLPPVPERLDAADAQRFRAIESRHPSDLHGLAGYESWAAALLVNASVSGDLSLSTENAGEAVLSGMFGEKGKPVEGLETIEGQLGLFDRLPEADQRTLLTQAVREAGDAPRLYRDLYSAWSRGDVAGLERQFLAPFASAPTLRHVLIDERNRHWSVVIDRRLRSKAQVPFIAVGAGHLLGGGSLPERLSRLGWRVERLQ